MRKFLSVTSLVMALALGLTFSVAADEAPNAAIQSTINNQIAAFQVDDFAKAFTYASPNIKRIFGTAENFGSMVRNGYPMVHHPSAVRMLELRDENGVLWQRVLITDNSGNSHVLEYQMIETADGWQINAVQILPKAGVGA